MTSMTTRWKCISREYGIYILACSLQSKKDHHQVPSPESHCSLLRTGNRLFYLFCAWSWTWSKETYLSGKMSVISFSNQFSGCFSHNSGDFLAATRTEDPFIPCLYLSVPLYHRMELAARKVGSLYTMPASPPRDRYRLFLVPAFLSTGPRGCLRAKTWNSLGTDFGVLLDPSDEPGLVKPPAFV